MVGKGPCMAVGATMTAERMLPFGMGSCISDSSNLTSSGNRGSTDITPSNRRPQKGDLLLTPRPMEIRFTDGSRRVTLSRHKPHPPPDRRQEHQAHQERQERQQ
mmetsp:Transcript_3591/g.8201  ORF Transcript_3591/g.8201 Transcript_3591/m.8201 type:complete len:104 (+) Transcript_3591:346-657(+)